MTYSGHKPCPDLKPGDVCLVVEQYSEGQFSREFHHHVRKSRLNQDDFNRVLRALVVHFSRGGPKEIVRSHLNAKGKDPDSSYGFTCHVTYPEPGVYRQSIGENTVAWLDWVLRPSEFRKSSARD